MGTFTPGDHGTTIALRGHEVALSVCYYVDFPEHAAAAAADGATVYVTSGLYFLGSEHRRDLRNAARALDNGLYIVFSGFAGGSGIYDLLGQPLARLGRQPGLAIADLDLDLETLRRARDSQRAWADHRSSLGSRRHTDLVLPAIPHGAPGRPAADT